MTTEFKRILILDDDSLHNVFCTLLIKKRFPDLNMEIIGFTNPLEGFTYIETEYQINPVKTILFLDIDMPFLNGWQVLDRLKLIHTFIMKYFSIYILSSSIDTRDIKLAKESELAKDYLEKPLSNHLESVFGSKHETGKV